jgi:hypothetical protein
MDADARNALRTIRRCIAAGRYRLTQHFAHRMDQRGVTWPDVLALLDGPADMRADGVDDWGRDRWIISGTAADGLGMDLVCLLELRENCGWTLLVTIYWKDHTP